MHSHHVRGSNPAPCRFWSDFPNTLLPESNQEIGLARKQATEQG